MPKSTIVQPVKPLSAPDVGLAIPYLLTASAFDESTINVSYNLTTPKCTRHANISMHYRDLLSVNATVSNSPTVHRADS